eukprot:3941474-Rhodomonas_salina.1
MLYHTRAQCRTASCTTRSSAVQMLYHTRAQCRSYTMRSSAVQIVVPYAGSVPYSFLYHALKCSTGACTALLHYALAQYRTACRGCCGTAQRIAETKGDRSRSLPGLTTEMCAKRLPLLRTPAGNGTIARAVIPSDTLHRGSGREGGRARERG